MRVCSDTVSTSHRPQCADVVHRGQFDDDARHTVALPIIASDGGLSLHEVRDSDGVRAFTARPALHHQQDGDHSVTDIQLTAATYLLH